MGKLTNKQKAFILEYPKDFNAKEAAIRAGYSKKTAKQMGHENLTKPYLKEKIDEEFDRRSLKLGEILARFTEQATASIGDFITINPDGDRISFDPEAVHGKGHLIKRIKANTTVRYSKNGDQYEYTSLDITLHDAQKALELLGKHRGMGTVRVELTGKDGGPIELDAGEATRELLLGRLRSSVLAEEN